jgi:hypothetical protein
MRKWQIKLCLCVPVTLGSRDAAFQIAIEQQMHAHPKQDAYGDYFSGRAHIPTHNAAGALNNPDTRQKSAA